MRIREVDEFLDHALLEKELRIERLQFRRRLLEFLRLGGVALRSLGDVRVILRQLRAHLLHLPAEARQLFQVALATLDFLIEDHAVETFAAFGEFACQIEMRLRDETEAMDVRLHLLFGFLDPLGNLHFLLARQQRHRAHLLQIHPHRIVEDVELRLGFFLLFVRVLLPVLEAVDLGGLDNVDLEFAQPLQDEIELFRVGQLRRQRLVQVVESEVALFLRELDQLAGARLGFVCAVRLRRPVGLRRSIRVRRLRWFARFPRAWPPSREEISPARFAISCPADGRGRASPCPRPAADVCGDGRGDA